MIASDRAAGSAVRAAIHAGSLRASPPRSSGEAEKAVTTGADMAPSIALGAAIRKAS